MVENLKNLKKENKDLKLDEKEFKNINEEEFKKQNFKKPNILKFITLKKLGIILILFSIIITLIIINIKILMDLKEMDKVKNKCKFCEDFK